MRAVRLVGVKELVVDDIADPVIGDPHNAIIDVTVTAICAPTSCPIGVRPRLRVGHHDGP